jgi:hypothetical protein
MAQTGFTPIQIYRSSTASAAPTSGNLVAGELAINTADGKLFYLDSLNAVQVIGWKLVPVSAGGTGTTTSTGTGSVVLSDAPSLTGAVNISSLTASQAVFTDASSNLVSVATIGIGDVVLSAGATLTGAVTIGSPTGADTLTLGRSTGTQTVNIATGVNVISAKTVNIGTGATNGATTVNIAPSATTNGNTTVNIATQARSSNATTVNIGTNATGGNSNITLGSSGAATVITSNGIIQQRIYTGINAQAATAGRVAFVSDHRSSVAYPIFGEAYSISGTFGPFNVPVFADGTIWRVG